MCEMVNEMREALNKATEEILERAESWVEGCLTDRQMADLLVYWHGVTVVKAVEPLNKRL